jgi:two-component sensor histidine kinase
VEKDTATPGAVHFRLLSDAMEELCSARTQEEIVRIGANLASKACGVTGLSIVLGSGEQFEISVGGRPNTFSLAIQSKVIMRLSAWTLQSGLTAVVPDVHRDERTRSHTNGSMSARSLVVVPVGGTKPFAAITWSWLQEHWAAASEVLVLETLARATVLALAHRLSQEQSAQRVLSSGVIDWLDDAAGLEGLRGTERGHWIVVAELQHRVRHVLSLVRSLVHRTSETNSSPQSYVAHLEGRIGALARAQAFLIRQPMLGVDLETLAEGELAAVAPADSRVEIGGPRVRLRAKATETLGLALHELATNALKFGALAFPTGKVHVTWLEEPDREIPSLRFEWAESGVQIDTPTPTHRGFGRDLIERTVPYELRGSSRFGFEPGGIRCVIDIPLTPDNVITKHTAVE